MAKEIVLLVILVLAVFGEARHTHPRQEQWDDTEPRVDNVVDYDRSFRSAQVNHEAAETEIVKSKPLSTILFFKSFEPCEDGFKQDYQGICREVWF